MSEQGKANYEAYRKLAGRPGVSAQPLPEYEQLPMELAYAFDAGADAVEKWLADAPVDEDMPGNEPQPEPARYALVEQMGHRATPGIVRETTFCGKQMLEVTDLRTGAVHLVSPESLYEITWLTEDEARVRAKPWTAIAIPAANPSVPDDDDDDEFLADAATLDSDFEDDL